jgi:hypothetical protein
MMAIHQSFGQSDKLLDSILGIFDESLCSKRQIMEIATLYSTLVCLFIIKLNSINSATGLANWKKKFVEY